MATYFDIAVQTKAKNFVVSTADVSIANMKSFGQKCSVDLSKGKLFVISRREEKTPCKIIAMDRNGYDVFVGSTKLATPAKLENLVYSPRFWGVESVAAHVLSITHEVVNICTMVDVFHHHAIRSKNVDNARTRINHPQNDAITVGGSKKHRMINKNDCRGGGE